MKTTKEYIDDVIKSVNALSRNINALKKKGALTKEQIEGYELLKDGYKIVSKALYKIEKSK